MHVNNYRDFPNRRFYRIECSIHVNTWKRVHTRNGKLKSIHYYSSRNRVKSNSFTWQRQIIVSQRNFKTRFPDICLVFELCHYSIGRVRFFIEFGFAMHLYDQYHGTRFYSADVLNFRCSIFFLFFYLETRLKIKYFICTFVDTSKYTAQQQKPYVSNIKLRRTYFEHSMDR